MDRFILFAGDHYYPAGGAEDMIGFFPTVSAAVAGLLRRGLAVLREQLGEDLP